MSKKIVYVCDVCLKEFETRKNMRRMWNPNQRFLHRSRMDICPFCLKKMQELAHFKHTVNTIVKHEKDGLSVNFDCGGADPNALNLVWDHQKNGGGHE